MELAQVIQGAQGAQAAQGAGGLALLGTALALGLRHGIDWDHLAAIMDITGSARVQRRGSGGTSASAAISAQSGHRAGAWRAPFQAAAGWRPVWLASLYAVGHALVVVALGLAALLFGAILPDWVDPIMERAVGATLLFLGCWVVYSLIRFWQGGDEFRLQSRWMLVFAGTRRGWGAIQRRLHGHSHAGAEGQYHVHRVDQYGPGTAFGTGLIHGVGAETGTQVLIIAAVGGAASQGLGVWMLLAFVVGLLLSNTSVALLTSFGFISAGRARMLYVAAGCLAAVFSLWVGSYAVLGMADQLPDIQAVLSALFEGGAVS